MWKWLYPNVSFWGEIREDFFFLERLEIIQMFYMHFYFLIQFHSIEGICLGISTVKP